MAINTGLRQAEVLGLVWSNIDFKAGSIRVDGQLERARVEDGIKVSPHRVEYAKSEAGSRTVTLIDADLFKALRKHLLGEPGQGTRRSGLLHARG